MNIRYSKLHKRLRSELYQLVVEELNWEHNKAKYTLMNILNNTSNLQVFTSFYELLDFLKNLNNSFLSSEYKCSNIRDSEVLFFFIITIILTKKNKYYDYSILELVNLLCKDYEYKDLIISNIEIFTEDDMFSFKYTYLYP